MNIYRSKSSFFVKIITLIAMILMSFVALTLLITNKNYGLLGGTVLSLLTIGTILYFFANSLNRVILEKDKVILKKTFGQIAIPFSEIKEIKKLEYSNLTMTYGSRGVFGFIGNTMDDSISFVKDRKQMFQIITDNKKYVLSSENSTELINEIKNVVQQGL
ncbi:PH domain-containing protein [Sediminicola sp. YIK13]|uniref:PH domain-containing protein n=1 Tax=Sediminicola sp. YIK13 TaxID=1453352 RepID=UPI0011A5434F|nr:PH domain-containing protein [Sediminicola sp. YIK13]